MDKVAARPVLAKSLGERIKPAQKDSIETEEERMEYVRTHISTQYHTIGTVTMGEALDDRLKVKGVWGLRVVDASVFPGHVSGNIMATTYAVAEKGAENVTVILQGDLVAPDGGPVRLDSAGFQVIVKTPAADAGAGE